MDSQSEKAERTLSCGILIQSPAGWLLAHATRTPRWDIPKGKIEPGETPIEAALRETKEEIGLDLSWAKYKMVDMGQHPYLPRKDLHLFRLMLDEPLDLSTCSCSTFIHMADGEKLPETDDYEWIPVDKVHNHIGRGLQAYMMELGLLDEQLPVNKKNTRLSF